ncbi:MAG TPA: aldehyde ferredoxin oxidoreductase family protein, partial [Spirochaetia bacterium]|nr:aldehyde ferredoxin oxidoreductase family protein [Spirochaetia bacterium]
GVFGKVLVVDLNSGNSRDEPIEDRIYEKYLGGKGLGSYLLLKMNPQGVDPLAPENVLIFGIGPANGYAIWGANRYAIYTKSPLTRVFTESYSGGKAYLPLSRIGYDAVVLAGALDKWCYLEIDNGKVAYKDAGDLLGKDSFETEEVLQERYKGRGASVMTIGPAGERLVKYAYVNNDRGRCAGRTGVGAVLGSKKIKAVVFIGDRKKEAADADLLAGFRKELQKIGSENPGVAAYNRYGTSQLTELTSRVEAFPSRYWQDGTVPHVEKIKAPAMHETLEVKPSSCQFCFISCVRSSKVLSGRHAGLELDGPEYETIFAFGGLNCVEDINEIAYLNDICDREGIDTITAGNVTAFAIEAYKRGKIDFAIDYGQVDRIAELLHMIAAREGIGNLLAEGVRAASRELGLEEIAIHSKGLEPPGYEPRWLNGMALAFAVSDRGACHLRATFYKPELAGLIDPQSNEGKAKMFVELEDRLTIFDTLILCRFYRDLLFYGELATIVKGTLGLDLTEKDFRKIARDITMTIREFNLREGMTPADDTIPEYFFDRPLGSKKVVLPKAKFQELLDDYYHVRGFVK